MLLASADRMAPADIGQVVGRMAEAVRNAVRAFEADGLACLATKSRTYGIERELAVHDR